MVQSDYIMRMIDQLSVFLAKIVFLKRNAAYEEAAAEVARAIESLLPIESDRLFAMTVDEFESFCLEQRSPESCVALFRLLNEYAEVRRGSIDILEKAFVALTAAERKGCESGKYAEAAAALLSRTETAKCTPTFLRNKFEHYERRGLYGKAEDCLLELADEGYAGVETLARDFYGRLFLKDDVELSRGNLPRIEVMEGRAFFENRLGVSLSV